MIRKLRVTPDLWIDFLKNDTPVSVVVCRNALPKDAKCVGVDYDLALDNLVILIKSQSFRADDPEYLESPMMKMVDLK